MSIRSLAACSVISLTAVAAWGIRCLPFPDVVKMSEVIVVADVKSVVTGADGVQIATAVPVEYWKGSSSESVQFVASPTWACDISTAIVGERAVLFLHASPTGQTYIAHSGYGRLPIKQVSEQLLATFGAGIIFPAEFVQTSPTFPADGGLRYLIPLDRCKQLVVAAVAEQQRERDAEAAK